VKQLKADGVPMDFDSPFRGTKAEAEYLREKRSNQTDLEFEDWVIEKLPYLPTKDRKILHRKDIVMRNIIISSQGLKPTFDALTLPEETFVDKYIKKDFNPSINMYFLATVAPSNKNWLQEHLLLESFAHKLVGNKGMNMLNGSRFIDLFENKFSFDASKNPDIYIGPSENKILTNYAVILLRFGTFLKEKVTSSGRYKNIKDCKSNISEEDKKLLKNAEDFIELSIELIRNDQFYPMAFNDLREVYYILGIPENIEDFFEKLMKKDDSPVLHFFKGQMLLDKLIRKKKITAEQKDILISTIENEFKGLMNFDKKEMVNAYTGLLDLYSEIGKEEKKQKLVEEILREREIFSSVFMYNYKIKKDTATSIYLLEKWLEVNKDDKEAFDLLESFSSDFISD
jgi:hypothetical protein